METPFSELVIEGPFLLVKGFLMGHWASRSDRPAYFFHRKAGIRRQTLKDLMTEWFELENLVHLCLEDRAVEAFAAALEASEDRIGLQLKSRRRIRGAGFGFHYEVYNRELAEACRRLLADLPEGVVVSGAPPVESTEPRDGDLSLGYAPEPLWALRGKGRAEGAFDGVAEFYRRCRSSELAPFLLAGEIELALE